MKIHLLPNAHLDPVWLWDGWEGLTEAVTTVRTVLDLMEEFPELTFLRGESLVYEEVQRRAPGDFERIRSMIAEGRWDVVGGTYIQPDTNLCSTATLCRQFEVGLGFFERELGVRPTVAWQADCFGHTPGWPRILRAFGMTDFAYFRPQRFIFPMDEAAFWWGHEGEEAVLCYRPLRDAYCCERGTAVEALESIVARAEAQPLESVAVFFGLGNHGGGPTRRHIEELLAWREAHPEHEVVFSTLHRFFADLRRELREKPTVPVPRVSGEIGHCLRGVYSSVQGFKSWFRRTEEAVLLAETTARAVRNQEDPRMEPLWRTVLFNAFHDILPGTSIERAMIEQENAVRGAHYAAGEILHDALTELAGQVDTSVPPPLVADRPRRVPVLLWNALPRPWSGPVEIEVPLDYRMVVHARDAGRVGPVPFGLWEATGEAIPFQEIETENDYVIGEVWRKRVVARVNIPAGGWRVVHMGLSDHHAEPASQEGGCRSTEAEGGAHMGNSLIEVLARPGDSGITLRRRSHECLLSLVTVADPFGSWGHMGENRAGFVLDDILHEWVIEAVRVVEHGPERAKLWVRLQGGNSLIEWILALDRGRDALTCDGRLLWNERASRLQWILPGGGNVTRNMPGGRAPQTERGQVPFFRWWQRVDAAGSGGFVSDVLGDADFLESESRVTLARSAPFAKGQNVDPAHKPWRPAMDQGLITFRARLFFDEPDPDRLASEFCRPPVVHPVTPAPGRLPAVGTLGVQELTFPSIPSHP